MALWDLNQGVAAPSYDPTQDHLSMLTQLAQQVGAVPPQAQTQPPLQSVLPDGTQISDAPNAGYSPVQQLSQQQYDSGVPDNMASVQVNAAPAIQQLQASSVQQLAPPVRETPSYWERFTAGYGDPKNGIANLTQKYEIKNNLAEGQDPITAHANAGDVEGAFKLAQLKALTQKPTVAPESALGKLALDHQRGLIDDTSYKAAVAKESGAGVAGGFSNIDPNLSGPDFLAAVKQQNPQFADQVQAIGEGRVAWPTATRNPQSQALRDAVVAAYPDFNAADYNARANTRKDFTSGKAAQTISALNTAIGHADHLAELGEKLNNGDLKIWNSIKNEAADATGDPDINNFKVARNALSDEIAKVYVATGGSVDERDEIRKTISESSSPEQLKGALSTAVGLMGSKIDSLKTQYQNGLGTIAGNASFYSPKAVKAFERFGLEVNDPGQYNGNVSGQLTASTINDAPAGAIQPPAAAISHLQQNPALENAFDAKYGKGAASRVLNGN